MKAILGVLSLLVVLGLVSLLARKQLPSGAASAPQVQQQVQQQVETLMQKPREMPDEK